MEEVRLPFLGDPLAALMTIVYGEIAPYVKGLAKGREGDLHAVGAGVVGTPDPSFADYRAAEAKAEALRSAFAGYFQKYDVLLCPVNPMTATPHGATELVVNGEDGAVDSRYACDFAVQSSRFTRALGPVRLQLGEAPDRDSTRLQVAG